MSLFCKSRGVVDKDIFSIPASDQMKFGPKKNTSETNIHSYSPYEQTIKNISDNVNIKNIKFIKGKVEETLLNEKNLPEKISILRLDTDFYSSTKIELEVLFKRLVKGGILFIEIPFNIISPWVAVSKPASIIKQVVLPEPDGPSIVKNSPFGISRLRSFTTRVSPS